MSRDSDKQAKKRKRAIYILRKTIKSKKDTSDQARRNMRERITELAEPLHEFNLDLGAVVKVGDRKLMIISVQRPNSPAVMSYNVIDYEESGDEVKPFKIYPEMIREIVIAA